MACVYCHKVADINKSVWLVNDVDVNNDEICHHKCLQNMLHIKEYIGMIRFRFEHPERSEYFMKMYADELTMYQKDCYICHKYYFDRVMFVCYFNDKSIVCHRKCLIDNFITMPEANEIVGLHKYNHIVDVQNWSDMTSVVKGARKRSLLAFKKKLHMV